MVGSTAVVGVLTPKEQGVTLYNLDGKYNSGVIECCADGLIASTIAVDDGKLVMEVEIDTSFIRVPLSATSSTNLIYAMGLDTGLQYHSSNR